MRSAEGRRGRLLALCLAAMLGLVAVVVVEGSATASEARGHFLSQQELLLADVRSAHAEGYGADDLQPVTAAKLDLERAEEPPWIGDRSEFYHQQAQRETQLREQLISLRLHLLDQSQKAASARLQDASNQVAEDIKLGTDEADLKPIQLQLDLANKQFQAAHTLADFRTSAKQSEVVAGSAADVGAAQKAELTSIQLAADQLKGKPIDSLIAGGRDSLTTGRDEAAAATWLKVSGFDRPYKLLEKYALLLSPSDTGQAAIAAAALKRYGDQIHQSLMRGMPPKAILISMAGQYLAAYEAGKLVQETYVTTGRPPDLATDIGPMKVLWKQAPWKMHSPWPKESPYWYPDTLVQRVVWFTNTGEGLHDASWQPDGTYGPGSQYGPSASHGCIHVPPVSEAFLFGWVDYGTPVVIYPGDGQPLRAQLAQKTTDDDGNPFTGPKGA